MTFKILAERVGIIDNSYLKTMKSNVLLLQIIHDNEYLGPHYSKVHEIGGLPYFEAHVLDENNEIIEDRY